MNETHVTIRGNLVADPDRIDSAKGAFTTFRVAVNEFHRDQAGGGYVDGRSSFYKVVAFRAVGDNVHRSLKKGMPVLVQGVLRINQWQTSSGETRTTPEIEAHSVGPDLRFGIATYQRVPGQGRRAAAGPLGAGAERPSWQSGDASQPADPWGNDPGRSGLPVGGAAADSGADAEHVPSSGPLVEHQEQRAS